jgi:hypothetical protein
MKQSYRIENVLLLTYKRLQNIMLLVLGAMYFAAVCVGDTLRLGVLAHYALAAAMRLYGISDLRFYAVADGMKRLLRGPTRPFAGTNKPLLQEIQLSLFGP